MDSGEVHVVLMQFLALGLHASIVQWGLMGLLDITRIVLVEAKKACFNALRREVGSVENARDSAVSKGNSTWMVGNGIAAGEIFSTRHQVS